MKPFLLIIIQNWNLERLNTESAYFWLLQAVLFMMK